jgi:chitodextrinase
VNTNPPTAPTNLAASQTTTSSTNLSWTASTDDEAVTGYYVCNGEEIITAVSGTSYTVTGLNSNTAYTFTVQAKMLREFINS